MTATVERSRLRYRLARRLKSNSLRFAIASIAFGIAGSAAYSLVLRLINASWATAHIYRGHLWLADVLLLLAALIGLAILKSSFDQLIRKLEKAAIGELQSDTETVSSHSALVVFLSYPTGDAHVDALRHHLDTGEGDFKLRYWWLVFTQESKQVRDGVHAAYSKEKYPDLSFYDAFLTSAFDALKAQACVERAIEDALNVLKRDSNTNELIVDITGGTKPMSIGAVLACVERGVSIEYMQSLYGSGKRDPTKPSIAMLVETTAPRDLLADSGG